MAVYFACSCGRRWAVPLPFGQFVISGAEMIVDGSLPHGGYRCQLCGERGRFDCDGRERDCNVRGVLFKRCDWHGGKVVSS